MWQQHSAVPPRGGEGSVPRSAPRHRHESSHSEKCRARVPAGHAATWILFVLLEVAAKCMGHIQGSVQKYKLSNINNLLQKILKYYRVIIKYLLPTNLETSTQKLNNLEELKWYSWQTETTQQDWISFLRNISLRAMFKYILQWKRHLCNSLRVGFTWKCLYHFLSCSTTIFNSFRKKERKAGSFLLKILTGFGWKQDSKWINWFSFFYKTFISCCFSI